MRKTLILILLLTFLSAGTMAYAAFDIYPLRNQVSVFEITELYYDRDTFGDASAADGLTATLKNDYYEAMRWNTKVHFGNALPETETEYTLQLPLKKTTNYNRTGNEIRIRATVSNALDGIDILKDLAENLKPGEYRSQKIYLHEYTDYYTIEADLFFPHGSWQWRPDGSTTIDNEMEATLKKLFDENFLFPIGENVSVDGHAENKEYGPSYGYSINSSSEGFVLSIKEAFAGDSAYFSFNSKAEGYRSPNLSHQLDTSYLPLGYGIYCLTVPEDGSQPALTNVCPLEIGTTILKLTAEEGGERVLAHTVENGIYTVNIISTSDNSVSQKLELTEFPANSDAWAAYETEGCTAVTLSHKLETRHLILLTCNDTGKYQILWNQAVPSDQSPMLSYHDGSFKDYYYDYSPVIAWNGQYLAFGLSEEYRSGFDLALYDADGLVYSGRYNTSLNFWPVGPDKETPLTLEWK